MAEANEDTIVCRQFSLTVDSAENLPNVREVFKTRAYAKISIRSADKKIKRRTDVDRRNGLNPKWSYPMAFQIAESGVLYYCLTVVIKLYCERTLGDRYIGEVHMAMKDLFDTACSQGGSARLSLPITRGTEETGGILKFSCSFGERFAAQKSDFLKKAMGHGVNFMSKVAEQLILFAILPS